jgi:hypothetical protein
MRQQCTDDERMLRMRTSLDHLLYRGPDRPVPRAGRTFVWSIAHGYYHMRTILCMIAHVCARMPGSIPALKWRHVVVGTRFCASAARPTAGNAVLEQRPLPILPTAFHGDPAKTSTPERSIPAGTIPDRAVVPKGLTCSSIRGLFFKGHYL